MVTHGGSVQSALSEAMKLIRSSPPTWQSALLNNLFIFVLGSPILVSGLSLSGIGAAFLLGILTWRAFGPPGFLLVATYFIIPSSNLSQVQFQFKTSIVYTRRSCLQSLPAAHPVSNPTTLRIQSTAAPPNPVGTAATKVKMAQKEAQGVAEKRKGRRGPSSVIGSSAAGCLCAFLSIFGVGGEAFSQVWKLGFVASFCTKLSDTVSSEIGKAYGKTTYLVTTLKVVPRGTEGAVSVEGTIAGFLASFLLAFGSCVMGELGAAEAIICVIASQIANVGESIIGAALQEKEGFRWLNNDVVNIINISMGSIIAVLMQQAVFRN